MGEATALRKWLWRLAGGSVVTLLRLAARHLVAALAVCCLALGLDSSVAFAQSADLQMVSVTDSPDPVIAGNNITYAITVINNGPDSAGNGGWAAPLPAGTTFVSAIPPVGWNCQSLGGNVSCTIPNFAPGSQVTTTLVVNVVPTRVSFSTDLSATVTTITPDPNNGNNNGNASTEVTGLPKGNTSTSVSPSVNPSVFGQSVTFTATVAPTDVGSPFGTPTGQVTFTIDGSPQTPVALSDGQASVSSAALAIGSHTITAAYGGDGSYETSTSLGLSQTVSQGATTTGVVSDLGPSSFGQMVTFTATVAPVSPAAGVPTGTVTFKRGETTLGTGALSGGNATFQTGSLATGNHVITAVYNGDTNFAASTSSDLGQTVNKGATTTGVVSDLGPSSFGQMVTFTATVAPVSPAAGVPTGNITFKRGAATLGTGTLASGGTATFATSSLAVGAHTITAVYNGDTNFAASTSSGLTQTVNQGATTTVVSSNHNPSVSGQSVTFTATVAATAPAAGTPTGTVTFKDGAATLGTGTLSGGTATFATSALAVGAHTITAVYGGDTNFATSTSSGLTQTVNKGKTKTVLTSKPKPSKPGQTVTLTARVKAVVPARGKPSGMVVFRNGGQRLGARALAAGEATLKTSALKKGNHKFTANYAGNASFAPSTAPPLTHPVRNSALAVAKLNDGGFVAAWEAKDKDGRSAISLRRYPSDERSAAKDMPVAAAGHDRSQPSITGLRNGGFVVVWTGDGQEGDGLGVHGQRYSAAGAKLGHEFRVNVSTHNDQSRPSVVALSDGGFVIAWESNQQTDKDVDIYARRYNAAGNAAGGEFRVAGSAGDQTQPFAAALKDGGFVVAWQSDGSKSVVRAQRYDSEGRKAGAAFGVSTAASSQTDPSATGLSDGGFVIAWTSDGGVSTQRFDAAGRGLGEAKINVGSEPAVAAFAGGGFVVVWNSGGGQGMRAQAFGPGGTHVTNESSTGAIPSDASHPRVATLPDGNFVVLWMAAGEKSGLQDVRAQRFSTTRSTKAAVSH